MNEERISSKFQVASSKLKALALNFELATWNFELVKACLHFIVSAAA
jgi:hypothetical protein